MMRCKIESSPNIASGVEAPVSTAKLHPIMVQEVSTAQQSAPVANLPSKPREQHLSISMESKPIIASIPPPSNTIQQSTLKPEVVLAELTAQNYEVRMFQKLIFLLS